MKIPYFAASGMLVIGSVMSAAQAQTLAPPALAAPASMNVPLNARGVIDVGGPGITGASLSALPAHGVVTLNGTKLSYTPTRDYFGADSFSYVTYGGTGASPATLVSVTVTGRADPALDQAAAGLMHAQADAARRFSQGQLRNFQHRLEALHGSVRNDGVTAQDTPVEIGPRGADIWVGGGLRFGSRDAQPGSAGLAFSAEGVSAGIDRRVDEQLALGIGLGFSRDTTEVGVDGSRSRAKGVSLAAYASYRPGEQSYIDGVLGVGALDYDAARYVAPLNTFASAQRAGHYLFASLTGGVELAAARVRLAPYGRLDLATYRLGQSSETGAGQHALQFASQRFSTSQFALGLRAGTVHETDFGWVMPRARIELQHDFSGLPQGSAAYADQTGNRYQVGALPVRRDALLLGLGGDFVLLNGLRLSLDYLMQTSGGGDKSQMVMARLVKDLDGKGPAAELLSLSAASSGMLGLPVEAGIAYDDNVGHGADADMLSDTVYSVTLRKRRAFPLGEQTRVVLSGFLSGEKYRTYAGLGHIGGGAGAEFQYRTSTAWNAPTFGAFANLSGENYDSELRDGQRYSLGLSISQALSRQLSLYGALARNLRNAKSAVFDTRDTGARLHLDYKPGVDGILYAGAEYRHGDVTSSSTASLAALDLAKVLVKDDVFTRQQFFNYRFDGRTVVFTAGYNLPFGPKDSLDFSWRMARSRSDDRPGFTGADYLRYDSHQFSVNYLSSF